MKIYDQVKQLSERVKQSQKNINGLMTNIDLWSLQPLYERKDNKKENLICLDDKNDRVNKRYQQITASSDEIKYVLDQNYHILFNIPFPPPPDEEQLSPDEMGSEARPSSPATDSPGLTDEQADKTKKTKKKKSIKEEQPSSTEKKGAEKVSVKEKGGKKGGKKSKKLKKATEPAEPTEEELAKQQEDDLLVQTELNRKSKWQPYLEYVDTVVKDKLIEAVITSLLLFLNEMGDLIPVTPFFELSLELHEPEIVYIPTIDLEESMNWFTIVKKLLDDILLMGIYMLRADSEREQVNYLEDIVNYAPCRQNYDDILQRIMRAIDSAIDFMKEFDEYSPIWTDDRQEYLRQFLLYSRQLTFEEMESLKDQHTTAGAHIKEKPPTVVEFKEQIDFYEEMYKKVETMQTEKILEDGWLRIDVKPIRQAILNTICKWGNLFKQHLYNHVINSLDDLENFIAECIAAMQVTLTEDDYDGLLKVMGYLFKVKERQLETDNMFEPLKLIMEMLKEYNVEFPEEIYVQLQEIPDRWQQCKKVTLLIE